MKNGYPSKVIAKAKDKFYRPSLYKLNTAEKYVVTASIPCVRGLSEAIKRVLAPLDIRRVMRPQKVKWSLMRRVKDRISTRKEAGIAYALSCGDCASVYIGEISRPAEQRMKEPQAHVKFGRTEMFAVAAHACGLNHQLN